MINDETSALDELDKLSVRGFSEDPAKNEQAILQAQEMAKSDDDLAALLVRFCLQEDRTAAFKHFQQSGVPDAIEKLISRFGVDHDSRICDLGCGAGHLAYSFLQKGYRSICAMDPNGQWVSGTGYLKSLVGSQINIVNDLDEWYKINHEFDAVLTYSTIHHWLHIPITALETRKTMRPGAYWFAFVEYFAITPEQLADTINAHPTRNLFKLYEWAYPASAYVDLIQSVGFQLEAVVPFGCWNNDLILGSDVLPENMDVDAISEFVDENLTGPNGTVEVFWDEVDNKRRNQRYKRSYLAPQAFVFRRV